MEDEGGTTANIFTTRSTNEYRSKMQQHASGLKRKIGVWGLSANMINIVVGAGIFALPAIVATQMGASSVLAYLFCAVLIMLIMLCYAEVGSKITISGGSYTYIENAFGPYAGFLGGNLYVIAAIISDATVANALMEVLASVWPFFKWPAIRVLTLITVFTGLAVVNVIGIKQGINLVKFITMAKLTPLFLLIVIGWKDVTFSNLAWQGMPTWEQLGKTSLVLFFAFQGADGGLNVGDEIINPKRTIPRAIFISITVVLLLYIAIQTVAQGVLGAALTNYNATPLSQTALVSFGVLGFTLLTIGAAVSMFGNLSGEVLNTPRVLYALARDKVLPIKPFSKIHKRFATPYVAIIVYAVIGLLLAIIGNFESLITAASASLLIIYLGVVLSTIKLRKTQKAKQGEFKIPGGLLVPVLATIITLYFLWHISYEEKIGAVILAATLSIFYLLLIIFKKRIPD